MNEITPRTFLKETIKLKVDTEAAFLELAARLYKIHTDNLWKGEYESYEEFLLEARISKATASKLETVYATFILKHKIPKTMLAEAGWSSLYAIASRSDTKEKAVELVERAVSLTRDDLTRSLQNEDGKQDRCPHTKTHVIKICDNCGFRVGVKDL